MTPPEPDNEDLTGQDITDAINADPDEIERLRRSRLQAEQIRYARRAGIKPSDLWSRDDDE